MKITRKALRQIIKEAILRETVDTDLDDDTETGIDTDSKTDVDLEGALEVPGPDTPLNITDSKSFNQTLQGYKKLLGHYFVISSDPRFPADRIVDHMSQFFSDRQFSDISQTKRDALYAQYQSLTPFHKLDPKIQEAVEGVYMALHATALSDIFALGKEFSEAIGSNRLDWPIVEKVDALTAQVIPKVTYEMPPMSLKFQRALIRQYLLMGAVVFREHIYNTTRDLEL